MSNKTRFKALTELALKHVQSNAAIYVNMIGAISQKDYSTVMICLKVLALHEVVGGIQNHLKHGNKKKDEKNRK